MKNLSTNLTQNVLNLHFGKELTKLNDNTMNSKVGKIKALIFLIVIVLSFSHEMKASHVMGADLSYRLIDSATGKYRIKLSCYRDCAGIQYGAEQLQIFGGGHNTTITMNTVSSNIDVTPICRPPDIAVAPTTNCPSGPVGSNGIKGVAKWVFEVDYTVGNNVGYVIFGWTTCCRNAVINTGQAGCGIWIQSAVNTDYQNNSVVFTTPPIPYWCKQRMSTYNHGAVDSFDPKYVTLLGPNAGKLVIRDSMEFLRIPAFQSRAANATDAFYLNNTPCPFASGLDKNNFLYTTSAGPVSLNPLTGSITCIPSITQDAVMAFAVKEHRAIPVSNGTYTRAYVGHVCRDIQFTVRDICDPITTPGVIQDSLKSAEYVNSTTVDICGAKYTQVSFKLVGAQGQTLKSKIIQVPNSNAVKNFTYNQTITKANGVDTLIGNITFDSTIGVGSERFILEAFYCTSAGMRISQYYTLLINFRPSVYVSKYTLYYCTGGRPARAKVNGGGTSYSWAPKTGITWSNADSSEVDLEPTVTRTYVATAKNVANSTTYCSLVDSVRVINIPVFNYNLGPKNVSLCLQDTFQVALTVQQSDTPYKYTWTDPSSGSLFDAANKRTLTAQNPKGVVVATGKYIVEIESKYGCAKRDTINVTLNGVVPNATAKSARSLICPGDTTMMTVNMIPLKSGLSIYPPVSTITEYTHASTLPQSYPTACNSAVPSTCYPNPYSALGNGRAGITRIIYSKAELNALGLRAGILRGLSFYLLTAGVNPLDKFEIRLAGIPATQFDARVTYPSYTVYSRTAQACNTTWNDYTFDRNFDWDGNTNLLVEVRTTMNSNPGQTNTIRTLNVAPTNQVAYKFSNTSGVSPDDDPMAWTGSGAAQTKPQIKIRYSAIDSTGTGATSILSTVWSPASQINPTGMTAPNLPRAIALANQKDSLFTATVGNALCYDTARVKIKIDTNFKVTAGGGKVLCKLGSTNPTVNLTSVIKGSPTTIQWTAINNNGSNDAGLPATTNTANITVTPNIGTWKYVINTSNPPCSASDTVIVTVNNGLTISFKLDSPICSASNGRLTAILPAGGHRDSFNYVWSPAVGVKDTAKNLAANTTTGYALTISLKSDPTCQGNSTTMLPAKVIPLNPTISSTGIACFGGTANLTANATSTLSPGPYTYNWTAPAYTGQTYSNRPIGTYQVTITDNITSCTGVASYTQTQPAQLTVSLSKVDVKCKGMNTGEITATASGGTITSSYQYAWTRVGGAAPQPFNNIINLYAGRYIVTVTDLNGCTVVDSIDVLEPVKALTLDSVVGRNCTVKGATNGNVVAYVSGGTSLYKYSYSNSTVNTNRGAVDSITTTIGTPPIGKGTYQVTVTDNNNCTVSGSAVVYDVVCKWNVSLVGDTIKCYGQNTGNISVFAEETNNPYAAGDVNNYWYKLYTGLNPSGSTPYSDTSIPANLVASQNYAAGGITRTFSSLPAQMYYIRVYTKYGCDTIQDLQYLMKQNDSIYYKVRIDTPSCISTSDGIVTVNVSNTDLIGGTNSFQPISMEWNGSGTFTANDSIKSGLASGNGSVKIRNTNNCVQTLPYILPKADTVILSTAILDTVRCFSEVNGMTRIILGRQPDARPIYDTASYATTSTTASIYKDTISKLAAGTYDLTVYYRNKQGGVQCQQTIPYTMVEPVKLTLTNTPTNPSCSYSMDGAILPTPVGGNLAPNYLASLYKNGSTVRNKNVDPSITPNYDTIGGLDSGAYKLYVTDRRGCIDSNFITLVKPEEFKVNMGSTNAACIVTPTPDGTAYVVLPPIGGNPTTGYTYQWSMTDNISGQTSARSEVSALITGLRGKATYNVTVMDSKNCVATKSVPVGVDYELQIPSITSDSALCYGSKGAIKINNFISVAVDGPATQNAPYTYSYSNGVVHSVVSSTSDTMQAVKGTYTVTITDIKGCYTIGKRDIEEPLDITIVGKTYDAICYNDASGRIKISMLGGTPPYLTRNMLWNSTPNQRTDSAISLLAGNYTVDVMDAHGCRKTQVFTVGQPTPFVATIASKKNITCYAADNGEIEVAVEGGTPKYNYAWNNGVTSTTNVAKNLKPSPASIDYRVTVTDFNGCTASASTPITQPDAMVITGIDETPVSCPRYTDGILDIKATGGVISNQKQYEISIDGGVNFVSGNKFTNLAAGDYSVVVKDNNGCIAARKATVGTPEELYITAEKNPVDSIKMGEKVDLSFKQETQSGILPTLTHMEWTPGEGLNCWDCKTPKATPYVTTDYTIEVRYHNNCLAKSKVRVNVKDPLDFFVPSAFTPGNGDGLNDILYVYGTSIKKVKFMVFNRWGEKVFESEHLSKGWDGNFKGEKQQVGVYSYFAEVEYLNGEKRNKKGSVTLIR